MNPYEVLGVSPSASAEEIREAYMKLVKKYHPDRYQDSDLKKQAEDKMKQINAAYDLLTKKQSSAGGAGGTGSYGTGSYGSGQSSYGGYGNYGGYGSYGSYGGYRQYGSYGRTSSAYTGRYSEEFGRVRTLINAGSIDAALMLLNQIPLKNAEWCFLYGMCCYRSGQYARAYEYVSRAAQMDPSNAEYATTLSSLRGASSATRSWTQRGGDYSMCTTCGSIICANMLCSLCCRGH